MKNFVQPGNVITFTGPTGGALSGAFLIVGAAFGINAYNVAQGAEGELRCGGVFTLPKPAATATTEFQAAYWDATAKRVTTVVGSNLKIGVFMKAYPAAAADVAVRLNDVF